VDADSWNKRGIVLTQDQQKMCDEERREDHVPMEEKNRRRSGESREKKKKKRITRESREKKKRGLPTQPSEGGGAAWAVKRGKKERVIVLSWAGRNGESIGQDGQGGGDELHPQGGRRMSS